MDNKRKDVQFLMTEYARIVDDEVVEIRQIDLDNIPLHKRDWWKPVIYAYGPIAKKDILADSVVVTKQEEPLDDLKASLKQMVDADAEEIRLKYITPGVGMSITYREKLEQAEEVIAQGQAAIDALDSAQAIAAYPTLAASIGIEAASLWNCAQTVIAQYQAWAILSHEIEKRRLGGKKVISESTDNTSAQAAYDAISWAGL